MRSNQLYLFKDVRFLPIFIVQFCGCLNDSIIKNALIILVTYKLSTEFSDFKFLVLLANIVFIVPFVIFASLAGQVADKYERSTVVKIIKLAEIAIILLAAIGFFINNLLILFSCICLMGIHSTFFGPIKYSVLPDLLSKRELLGANGLVEAGTFISILIGTMIGGFYNFNSTLIVASLVIIGIIGVVSSNFLPRSNNTNPAVKINFNLFQETINIVKYAHSKRTVYLAILGISWFWFVAAAILAQIPALTKEILGADENVANLFMATFSVGVGCGSFFCSKVFKNQVTTKYVFISALGISLCGIDLFFASSISAINYQPEQLKGMLVFLSKKHHWRIIIDLFLLAAIGGLYVVPLFAVMQHFSSAAYRSRVIAANNLINAIFMAGSTVILSLLFYLKFSIPAVILAVSLLNIIVAYFAYRLMPSVRIVPFKVLRAVLKFIFDRIYQVEVKGLENFYQAGARSVIIANHASYLDSVLLAIYLPANLTFAIDRAVSKIFWVRCLLKLVRALPVDRDNSIAIKTLINEVKKNNRIVIFPEGRISTTGALMKVYEGPGMIADKAGASILPVRIDGVQFTYFSKLKHVFKRQLFPKITITILPAVQFKLLKDSDNRTRRKYIASALQEIMTDMMFESLDYHKTLFQSLIESTKIYGFNRKIIQDVNNNAVSYRQLLAKSFALASLITQHTTGQQYIGLMLPNTVSMMITFFAMQACGRIPVMLDFSKPEQLVSASCSAGVKVIYTSRTFASTNKLLAIINQFEPAHIRVIYLEDLFSQITTSLKLLAWLGSYFPQTYYNYLCPNNDDQQPAVVIFTAKISTDAKIVVLSHGNIQANRHQLSAKMHFSRNNLAFLALPMFSCFSLTGAMITVLGGIKTFLYPAPTHYRAIPEIIYDIGATIIFSTETLLNGYQEHAHPCDLSSLRYVLVSTEALQSQTRKLWLDKYGIRIFQVYGQAECSSLISANTPMHYRFGTVGKLLSKIDYFIEPVAGILEGGRLHVKGPHIMLGSISGPSPGMLVSAAVSKLGLGWYDTGDLVKIDQDGYVTIFEPVTLAAAS